jgi:hypothetical protein
MFGFIKNLVKKSDNNFFLELKEEVETKLDEAKKEIKEITETKDTKKLELKQPNNGAKPTSTASSVPTKPAVNPDKNGKSPKKDTASAAKAVKEAETATASDPAQLIARATAKKQGEAGDKNFATKYLMTPSSNGRRRPGANMNSYLEMARQVKTPNK